jgi:hypothetical protein
MALYNNNSAPSPFGSNSGIPQPNVGAQFFLGCTVIDFTVSADWSSQGGELSVNLLEDTLDVSKLDYNEASGIWSSGTTYTQRVIDPKIYDWATGTLGSLPIIGSPQHFRLLDTGSNIIFQYDGILQSISRNASPSAGKIYSVQLSSPLKLLENCTFILKETPGYGHATEGKPTGISLNGYYEDGVGTNYAPTYFNDTTSPPGPTIPATGLDRNLTSTFGVISNINVNEIRQSPSSSSDLFIQYEKQNEGITFGSNNRSLNWENVYNIQNVYGVFENESFGLTNYARYGASRSAGTSFKEEGLRLDMIAFALDELINRNPEGQSKRYFGGNIISGTTTYNFSRVAAGAANSNPYFYGFDVYSFTNFMMGKLGADYVYPGDLSSNLLEFVSTLCSDAGVDFVVELNRIQTVDSNAPNYWDASDPNVDTVENYTCPGSLYNGGTFHLQKSFTNTTPGGIVSIKILDRRTLSLTDPQNVQTPFSKIAYQILGYEVPDYGDKNVGRINPGDPNPFDSAFEFGAFSATYLDPLDDDYYLKGTDGSKVDDAFIVDTDRISGYGGIFPVETKEHQNQDTNVHLGQLDINNLRKDATQTQISIQDNQNVTGKFIVGGKQSRITYVPQEYIYQYWGDVKLFQKEDCVSATGLAVANRSIPVVTPFLEPDDMTPFIMIDMKHVLGKLEFTTAQEKMLTNVAPKGVYVASVAEIRAAMSSKDNWLSFMKSFRPCVLFSIQRAFGVDIEWAKKALVGTLLNITSSGDKQSVSVEKTEERTKEWPEQTRNSSKPKKPSTREAKQDLDDAGLLKNSSTVKYSEFIDKMFAAIKNIGDSHYGKSWAAWTPQPTVKLTEEKQNVGEYQYSWMPADDAYLEPVAFDAFSAPQHTAFLKGGRLNSYANYIGSASSGDIILNRQKNLQCLPVSGNAPALPVESGGILRANDETIEIQGSGKFKFDFTSAGEDSVVDSNFCNTAKTSVKVGSEKTYTFVPYDYFHWYDRGRRPLIQSGTVYDISYSGSDFRVQYPAIAGYPDVPSGYGIYAGTDKDIQETGVDVINSYTKLPSSIDYNKTAIDRGPGDSAIRINKILCDDITDSGVATSGGISSTRLVDDFLGLVVPDHGLNCFTLSRFNTPTILFPPTENNKGNVELAMKTLVNTLDKAVGGSGVHPTGGSIPVESFSALKYAPNVVMPLEVGLAQQSIRNHYGPWFTSHNFIYGGKVEYVQDDTLVPENFIFPIYGKLNSADTANAPSFSNQLSGFVGLNYAGQALANSIDGYGQFAAEEGSITIPGAPLISRIGDALLDGPYITSLSISVGVNGIETQYSFNSVTPKAGKTNADIVGTLKKVSSYITKDRGNYFMGGSR